MPCMRGLAVAMSSTFVTPSPVSRIAWTRICRFRPCLASSCDSSRSMKWMSQGPRPSAASALRGGRRSRRRGAARRRGTTASRASSRASALGDHLVGAAAGQQAEHLLLGGRPRVAAGEPVTGDERPGGTQHQGRLAARGGADRLGQPRGVVVGEEVPAGARGDGVEDVLAVDVARQDDDVRRGRAVEDRADRRSPGPSWPGARTATSGRTSLVVRSRSAQPARAARMCASVPSSAARTRIGRTAWDMAP